MIRSLHIIDRLGRESGGAMQAVLDIARYLAQRGQPVTCVGSVDRADDVSHIEGLGSELDVRIFPRSVPKRYANSREFVGWLRKNVRNYDIVEIHAVFSLFTWRAAQVCRAMGKPYLIRPHGSLDPFDLRKHAWLKRAVGPLLIRPMLAGSGGVLLTAQLEADRLVTYGAGVKKVVMPLPVLLPEMVSDRYRFRRKHGIPDDAQVVLFLSRVDYKKGLDHLIPALAQVKERFPRLYFVLAGTGTAEFTSRVHGWLEQYKVRPFTKEVGFLSGQEKADAFAAADLFALPSLNENFGIVNIEAMHAGLPLLISEEVYIASEVDQAAAGFICKPNAGSVAEKLTKMLDGSLDLRAMGKRGRSLVDARFRPEMATDSLLSLYRSLVRPSAASSEKALGDRPLSTV